MVAGLSWSCSGDKLYILTTPINKCSYLSDIWLLTWTLASIKEGLMLFERVNTGNEAVGNPMLWFVKSLPVQSFLCLAGEVVVVEGCPHLLGCCAAEVFAATFLWDSVEHSSWDFPDVPRAHASLTSPLVTSSALHSAHPICDDALVEALWSINKYDSKLCTFCTIV